MTIAITGSTGRLGGRVAELLADLQPVLVVRDPDRAPAYPGCDVRTAEYRDYDSSLAALTGVDVVFMVSASESQRRREDHRRFVMAAEDAGVRHLVYTSFFNAAPDATFTLARDHAYTEEAIRGSSLDWTLLRDNFYLDDLVRFGGASGVIRGPAGDGRVAGVAIADVADVAASVLRDPGAHIRATYELTGPEALTLGELAERASAALGKEIRFEDQSLEDAYASRRAAYDVEDWMLDGWVSTYLAIGDGSMARVTDDVGRLTGHPPRSLEQVLFG